ncbi:MAG: hypothetical protein VX030_07300 [SAR324 cluster bacterium]|nr:hypothetical protein [SAR324 cluster bacterium]
MAKAPEIFFVYTLYIFLGTFANEEESIQMQNPKRESSCLTLGDESMTV